MRRLDNAYTQIQTVHTIVAFCSYLTFHICPVLNCLGDNDEIILHEDHAYASPYADGRCSAVEDYVVRRKEVRAKRTVNVKKMIVTAIGLCSS